MHKSIKKFCFLLGGTLLFAIAIHAQDKQNQIKDAIESKQYVFHAQTAMPLSGGARQLTTDYELKVTGNSVVSALPFFGRAYSLPYGTNDGGFNFTSTKFDYSVSPQKKGGWDISIKPTDVQDFKEFSLSVSRGGYGTLQVISNNRQPISFSGYVSPLK